MSKKSSKQPTTSAGAAREDESREKDKFEELLSSSESFVLQGIDGLKQELGGAGDEERRGESPVEGGEKPVAGRESVTLPPPRKKSGESSGNVVKTPEPAATPEEDPAAVAETLPPEFRSDLSEAVDEGNSPFRKDSEPRERPVASPEDASARRETPGDAGRAVSEPPASADIPARVSESAKKPQTADPHPQAAKTSPSPEGSSSGKSTLPPPRQSAPAKKRREPKPKKAQSTSTRQAPGPRPGPEAGPGAGPGQRLVHMRDEHHPMEPSGPLAGRNRRRPGYLPLFIATLFMQFVLLAALAVGFWMFAGKNWLIDRIAQITSVSAAAYQPADAALPVAQPPQTGQDLARIQDDLLKANVRADAFFLLSALADNALLSGERVFLDEFHKIYTQENMNRLVTNFATAREGVVLAHFRTRPSRYKLNVAGVLQSSSKTEETQLTAAEAASILRNEINSRMDRARAAYLLRSTSNLKIADALVDVMRHEQDLEIVVAAMYAFLAITKYDESQGFDIEGMASWWDANREQLLRGEGASGVEEEGGE